jgi:formylmethanofuran dehydrogenase subunit E-like metal-binding protein
MPAALSSFTWKDSELKLTQERYEEYMTDLEYTAWIVNELCQCRFAPVAKILTCHGRCPCQG